MYSRLVVEAGMMLLVIGFQVVQASTSNTYKIEV